MATKITDLVDPNEIEKLKQLDAELSKVLDTYTKVAKDLAKGLEISVSVVGDIDKLEKFLVDNGKEAANVQQRLTQVVEEQRKVIANTTNTISRQLMEQERVNKTQRDAYTEYDRVKKLLDQYHDTYEGQINRLVRLNSQLEANKKAQKDNEKALSMSRVSMEQYKAKQAELIAQHRSLTQEKRTLTQLMTAEEKAAQSQEGSYAHMSQQLELLKKAYKDLSDEGRNSDFGKELEESIQNLDAHLKDMAADMGEFQRNVGNYAVANNDLKKKYDELVGTLAALQSAYGKMSEADKASAEGKKLAASIDEVSDAAKSTKKTLEEQTAAVEDAKRSLGETSSTASSVKRDLKELVLEIANLSIEYQNLSEDEKNSAEGQELAEHIRDLTEKAGVLKDAIADTNTAITNAASDTRVFDQLSGSIQLAIDGYGLAQSAAEMLGISEGELAEIQTKLQAAIAASNAMTKIQNALQKQSAVMQGVANLQTKAGTIAIKLKTAAEGKGVVTTKLLTAAQWLFNKAAAASPIGLLVLAIMACIAAVYGLIKVFNIFGGDSEARKKKYEEEKKALEDLKKNNDKLVDQAKARGVQEQELSNLAIECRKAEMAQAEKAFAAASAAYDDDEDEYKEALDAKLQATQDYYAALEDAHNNVLSKIAEVEDAAIRNSMGEHEYAVYQIDKAYRALLDTCNTYYQRQIDDLQNLGLSLEEYGRRVDAITAKWNEEKSKLGTWYDLKTAAHTEVVEHPGDPSNGVLPYTTTEIKKDEPKVDKKRVDAAKKAANDLKKEVQAGEDALLKIITDSLERQRQAENLSYNRKLKELQDRLSKTKSTEVKLRTALNQQIEGLTAEHNRKLQEIEFSCAERRLKTEADLISSHLSYVKEGSQEEYDWTLKALDNQYAAELLTIQKAEADHTLTVEQAEDMRLNIERKYQKLREDAEEEHAAKVAELIEKRYAQEQSNQNNAYISAVNALKQRYDQELAVAQGNIAQQEAIKAKFEQDQAILAERYAQQTARASIAMLEEILQNEQLSAEDRLKFEQALAKAKVDLETEMANASIAQIERITEADNRAREQRQANAQQWLQIAADSLNTINELVGTVYDAKIAKVEEEQEANTAAGEAEQERISELVEKKVITEEEGEARKRAAEAQTAKKNEELEKKKQQLKHKQAVWDKANGVAQAGIATALAIMNALQMKPFPVGIAMAAIAGAMGAVQVATILATPIPKYAKGTDRHKGGPAIVGDGGAPELVIFGGKSWITPDTPTLVDMPAGAVVKPSINVIDDNIPGLTPMPFSGNNGTPVIVNNNYKRLEEKMDMFISVMRKHSNRQYQKSIDTSLNRYIADRI
jgi:hypothetical protein